MTTPPTPNPASPPPPAPPPADAVRAEEQADAAKTADAAPAPSHPQRERAVIVRDAYGREPYGADRYQPDGERDEVVLGAPPSDLPDPAEAALRNLKARTDEA